MNDISKSADRAGDILETIGEKAEDLLEHATDGVAEEMVQQNKITWALWIALVGIIGWSLWEGLWRSAFVGTLTLFLTLLPLIFQRMADFRLPRLLISIIVAFSICTLVMGEVFDFYETFWWWDVALHTGSAMMFGVFGVILIMLIFDNASIKASPLMVAFLAMCFAIAVGAIWEIFEFAMDQLFGLNMQKSGLVDTMWDLIVDTLGAIVGAGAGWVYLRMGKKGVLSRMIAETVRRNDHKFNAKPSHRNASGESLPTDA